jgi:HSP20 family protein
MNVVRYNPWKRLATVEDRFNHFWGAPLFPAGWRDTATAAEQWSPVVDLFEDDKSIVIKADLPGVGKENINIDLKDGILTLGGERSTEKEVKEENYYRRERSFGSFIRRFSLPNWVTADKIEAGFEDGVLRIEITKPEEESPSKITIN